MRKLSILTVLVVSIDFCFCQIFQEVPIGMGMPMMMPMPYSFYTTNPFDQEIELEYSPITQLVSSIAHLVEMHQKSKERSDENVETHQPLFPELSQVMRRRPSGPSELQRFNLIPFTHEGVLSSSATSSTSRIVNSIPSENLPSVMWRIGDLIGKGDQKHKENVYDTSKIKGFPITRVGLESSSELNKHLQSSENEPVLKDEKAGGKSWTILEIARKILGVDEIPTSEEGNAIVQLIEQIRKEKKEDALL